MFTFTGTPPQLGPSICQLGVPISCVHSRICPCLSLGTPPLLITHSDQEKASPAHQRTTQAIPHSCLKASSTHPSPVPGLLRDPPGALLTLAAASPSARLAASLRSPLRTPRPSHRAAARPGRELGVVYPPMPPSESSVHSEWLLGYRLPGRPGPPLTQAEADRVDYRLSAARRLARQDEGDSDSD